MNQVVLTGVVVRDFALNNSGKIAYSSLAVNPIYGELGWDKDKEKRQTNFIPLRFLGEKQANLAVKYLVKGTKLLVKGNMIYISKKDENGNYHDMSYVAVNNYEFIGGRKDQSQDNSGSGASLDEDLSGFMKVPDGEDGAVPFS